MRRSSDVAASFCGLKTWINVDDVVESAVCLQKGQICYFLIEDWAYVCEFNHTANVVNNHQNQAGVVGICMLFPDPSSTRLAYIDDKGDGYILNPV